MKLLEILYEILAEGRFIAITPQFAKEFNVQIKLSPEYKSEEEKVKKEVEKTARNSFDARDDIRRQMREFMAKKFVERVIAKFNLKDDVPLDSITFKEDKLKENIVNIKSEKLNGYIGFEKTFIKKQPYFYVSLDNSKLDYDGVEYDGLVHLIVPKNSTDIQFRVPITGVSQKSQDAKDSDTDKAFMKGIRGGEPEKGKFDPIPYTIPRNWDTFVFNKLKSEPDEKVTPINLVIKFVNLVVEMLVAKNSVTPKQLDKYQIQLKNIKEDEEEDRQHYIATKGPLVVDIYINPQDLSIYKSKLKVSYDGIPIYKN